MEKTFTKNSPSGLKQYVFQQYVFHTSVHTALLPAGGSLKNNFLNKKI